MFNWTRVILKVSPVHVISTSMTKKVVKPEKPVKRKSTVVSSQTYRKMVEEVLEEAAADALDLHGIYEALGEKYEQYREDSIQVDWRVRNIEG